MRFRDILLEYDRSKTVARYGMTLAKSMQKDRSAERYIMQAMKSLDDGQIHADDVYEIALANFGLAAMEKADPTPTKEYVSWLVTRYTKGNISRFEDITSTAADCLETYHEAKRIGFFKKWAEKEGDPELATLVDIGRVKTLYELRAICNSYEQSGITSNAAADRGMEEEMRKRSEFKLLYDDATWKVVQLKSKRAAIYFGRNTQWCTAARNDNMFAHYNSSGPLFVILNKPNNRRWQFHFADQQFMDENDEDAFKDPKFPNEIWGLIDWTKYIPDEPIEDDDFLVSMALGLQEDVLRKFYAEGPYIRNTLTAAYALANGERKTLIADLYRGQTPETPRDVVEGEGWKILFFQGEGEKAISYEIAKREIPNPGFVSGIWNTPLGERIRKNIFTSVGAVWSSDSTIHILETKKRHYFIEDSRGQKTIWVTWDGGNTPAFWDPSVGYYEDNVKPGFLSDCPEAWDILAKHLGKPAHNR